MVVLVLLKNGNKRRLVLFHGNMCRFLPDFEALKETVGVFRLVGLLTDDGPEPPGIIDH